MDTNINTETKTLSYTTMASAKRGAVRANIENPIFTEIDGRIVVTSASTIEMEDPNVKFVGNESAWEYLSRVGDPEQITTDEITEKLIELNQVETAEAVAVKSNRVTVSKIASPVEKFREIFAANYGKIKRGELLKMAVEAGIGKNTAATYYQKLSKA